MRRIRPLLLIAGLCLLLGVYLVIRKNQQPSPSPQAPRGVGKPDISRAAPSGPSDAPVLRGANAAFFRHAARAPHVAGVAASATQARGIALAPPNLSGVEIVSASEFETRIRDVFRKCKSHAAPGITNIIVRVAPNADGSDSGAQLELAGDAATTDLRACLETNLAALPGAVIEGGASIAVPLTLDKVSPAVPWNG